MEWEIKRDRGRIRGRERCLLPTSTLFCFFPHPELEEKLNYFSNQAVLPLYVSGKGFGFLLLGSWLEQV